MFATMAEAEEEKGTVRRDRMEVALGLFAVVGVGLALAVPEARPFGVAICLFCVAITIWLYKVQFSVIPYWCFRRRLHLPLAFILLPRDTIIAIVVLLIALMTPIYVLLKPAPNESPTVPPDVALSLTSKTDPHLIVENTTSSIAKQLLCGGGHI